MKVESGSSPMRMARSLRPLADRTGQDPKYPHPDLRPSLRALRDRDALGV